jgi:hypothetical protein
MRATRPRRGVPSASMGEASGSGISGLACQLIVPSPSARRPRFAPVTDARLSAEPVSRRSRCGHQAWRRRSMFTQLPLSRSKIGSTW